MNYIFYLVLIIGASGGPSSQSSTPIGSEKECVAAGEMAVGLLDTRLVKFICVGGRL